MIPVPSVLQMRLDRNQSLGQACGYMLYSSFFHSWAVSRVRGSSPGTYLYRLGGGNDVDKVKLLVLLVSLRLFLALCSPGVLQLPNPNLEFS